jgi:NAD+ diphosphatase
VNSPVFLACPMDFIQTFFSGGETDRMANLRKDAQALQAILDSSTAYLLPVCEGELLVLGGRAALLPANQRHSYGIEWLKISQLVYLGRDNGRDIFALDIGPFETFIAPDNTSFLSGRGLLGAIDSAAAALLAYARAMLNWHTAHQYCGRCGAKNESIEGGFVMQCSDCGQRSFPRLDPAVIVLVEHQERCLLGRQASWPEQRFSTIAGFAEPGENLEDAIRREVFEETNIQVGGCQYLASQPWPFPSALMIGFHAAALSTDIRLNDAELIEANWFSRDDLRGGKIILPPRQSIAFQLIAAWHDQGSKVHLADVSATAAFNAPSA